MWSATVVKERTDKGFGTQLWTNRLAHGMTQEELGDTEGCLDRVIAYYEADDARAPGALLANLAIALRVSADELLGLKSVKPKAPPERRRGS